MASGWAYYRKYWIKPEVYPLIGSMAAALGVCGAALLNKARDPSVTWNKTKRSGGVEAQLENVDEIVPMWSYSKESAIRIFGKKEGNPILANKKDFISGPISVTIAAADAENAEEDAEVESETEPESAAPEPVESKPVPEVIDEDAAAINAAVDAAMERAATIADTTESAAASVAEAIAPAEDSPAANSPVTTDEPKPAEA